MVLACRAAPVGEHPPPPPPPPGSIDTIPIAGQALYVPHGFTINLFASGVSGVRYLALGPSGAVYASLPGAGQIVRLVDADGDGAADGPPQPVLTGLDGPFGIAFRGDTMYFAEVTTVKRLNPCVRTPVTLVSVVPIGGDFTPTVVLAGH